MAGQDAEETPAQSESIPTRRHRHFNPVFRHLGLHIRTRFIAGLFLLVPLAITYLILRFLFDAIDGPIQPAIEKGVGFRIPGAGVVGLLVLTYLVGLLGTNVLGGRIIQMGEWFLMRIPLLRPVYSTSKQLMQSFAGTSTTGFKRVVLIEFPRPTVWAISFLTGMTQDEEGRPMAIVYIPTAPMPTSGYVNIVPADQVYDTDLTVQAAMSIVLSGGLVAPEQIRKRPLQITAPETEHEDSTRATLPGKAAGSE